MRISWLLELLLLPASCRVGGCGGVEYGQECFERLLLEFGHVMSFSKLFGVSDLSWPLPAWYSALVVFILDLSVCYLNV